MDRDFSLRDWNEQAISPNTGLGLVCNRALSAQIKRVKSHGGMPEFYIDPLRPLPLADAVVGGPAVSIVYFFLVSRAFAHQTVPRNVRALQAPRATKSRGENGTLSNLFLIHVDTKTRSTTREALRKAVRAHQDVYFMRRARRVMWSGASMVLSMFDAMASVLQRDLRFDHFINLSDADLTLRVDGEIRALIGMLAGRSVVQVNHNSRQIKRHARFRRACWFECDGEGWVVSSPEAEHVSARSILGSKTCCWSRSAPIVYTSSRIDCPSRKMAVSVTHGSQWVMLHRSLVKHIITDPLSRNITASFHHTLLPDEAILQTIALNSPLRQRLVKRSHMRYIAWPQRHFKNPSTYWDKMGRKAFHGGPMALDSRLLAKAVASEKVFARKVDPIIYPETFAWWDRWIEGKMKTQTRADGQMRIRLPGQTRHGKGYDTSTKQPVERLTAALGKKRV